MLKFSPLWGVGYGSFADVHELVAHNSFVHCFAELGSSATWPGWGDPRDASGIWSRVALDEAGPGVPGPRPLGRGRSACL